MAWSEHIHVHIHNDDQKEIIKLLNEIKTLLAGGSSVKELEAQMDSWLATLKQSVGEIETVSQQVDSTK